jgi:hypothetical protein
LLLLFLLAFSSFSHLSLFVPCYGTFCAFPWHISLKSLFVPCYSTFCAFPWHISPKSHFVLCYGTFCALLWHISLKSLFVNCKLCPINNYNIFFELFFELLPSPPSLPFNHLLLRPNLII